MCWTVLVCVGLCVLLLLVCCWVVVCRLCVVDQCCVRCVDCCVVGKTTCPVHDGFKKTISVIEYKFLRKRFISVTVIIYTKRTSESKNVLQTKIVTDSIS